MTGGARRLNEIRSGGKPALAAALVDLESSRDSDHVIALLDAAYAAPKAQIVGFTGPPGVGKSTLIGHLLGRWRRAGFAVGVIAVDPSSAISGGALLGDRSRIRTDPGDQQCFIRSMAARDRLGGLSDVAVAAALLMRSIFDRVIVESVGVGQSENDISLIADTAILCVQPGSGDALQYMKSGIIEWPDIVAVTKADMGEVASRTRADIESALQISQAKPSDVAGEVIALSVATGAGLDRLDDAVNTHWHWLNAQDRLTARRRAQRYQWQVSSIRQHFGRFGLGLVGKDMFATETPFGSEREFRRNIEAGFRPIDR